MRLAPEFKGVLGLFGGTFDPIHHGHLRTAFELQHQLALDKVFFIPAADPPHRAAPDAPAKLRLAMLDAALEDQPGCVTDRRELERAGPSYSFDTAISFRDQYPEHVLCLLLGMDAFLGLPSWYRWDELLDLVNLVVARRPGTALPDAGVIGRLLRERRIQPSAATHWPAGGGIIVQDVTQLEISASALRASIRAGLDPKFLVPEAVSRIIATSGCYAR